MRVALVTEGGGMRGLGHIARTCALGQGFIDLGCETLLLLDWAGGVVPELPKGIQARKIGWLERPGELFEFIGSSAVTVMDSYLAPGDIFHLVASKTGLMVSIDDSARIAYPSGAVINCTPYAKDLVFPRSDGVVYLLGPEFSLFRKGFWNVPRRNFAESLTRVLVTLGGGPVAPLVVDIVKAVSAGLPGVAIEVLASIDSAPVIRGCLGEGREDFSWGIDSAGGEENVMDGVNLHAGIGDCEVAALMASCDAAVTGGGQTLCEAAAMGLPAVCVNLAANQDRIISSITGAGAAFSAGRYDTGLVVDRIVESLGRIGDKELRKAMSEAGSRLMNSRGAIAAAEEILVIASGTRDDISRGDGA